MCGTKTQTYCVWRGEGEQETIHESLGNAQIVSASGVDHVERIRSYVRAQNIMDF